MKFFILIFVSIQLLSCSQAKINSELQTRQRIVMGTLLSVQLPESKTEAFEEVFQEFRKIDNKLSTYKKNSEVSQLNSGQTVILSNLTQQAFDESINLYGKTNGYFNIFTGKKTISARNNRKHLSLKAQIPHFKSNFNLDGNTLSLKNKAKIDLGGIAKGLAVDQSLLWLKSKKIKRAQVSASGDIGCIGPCKIFIQNPVIEAPLVSFTSKGPRLAVSTSGNYRKKDSHIVNPKTGRFVSHWLSVSLISSGNNTQLDAFATAVFSMPKDIALQFLKTNNIQFILIDFNKSLYSSDNLDLLVSEVKWLNTKDLKIK